MKTACDVVVIGGGPAGATAASLLAERGLEVVLLERQGFPRFHVGESLVPACNLVLERLGLLDAMDAQGFPRKSGVQFIGPRGPGRPFYFSDGDDERLHQTWQVLRSRFDQMLLDAARDCGAAVHMEARVTAVQREDGAVTGVEVQQGGASRSLQARIVIDASGLGSALARNDGGREHIAALQNAAVYAHFSGARLDAGRDAASTLVYRLARGSWLWFIPLDDQGLASVGLVTPASRLAAWGNGPEQMLRAAIDEAPLLKERLASATRTFDPRVERDYSYLARSEAGPGWALVGDALGFMDPVYSSGLLLALQSAELAADAAATALESSGGPPDLSGYAAPYRAAFQRFLTLVRAFYQEGFRFGELAADTDLRRGLVDLLSGAVHSPWAVALEGEIEQRLSDPPTAPLHCPGSS